MHNKRKGIFKVIREKVNKSLLCVELWSNKRYSDCEFNNNTIAIMRLDAIGDFIMAYSSFLELRRVYPQKIIVLLCTESCCGIARGYGVFDRIIGINLNRFVLDKEYKKSIKKEVKGLKPILSIQMLFHRPIETEVISSYLYSKDKIALSRDTNDLIRRSWDRQYNRIIDVDKNVHEIIKNFAIINALREDYVFPYIRTLPTYDVGHHLCGDYIVLSSGGSFEAKKWTYFGLIAEYILSSYPQFRIAIVGGKEDIIGNDRIVKSIKDMNKVVDLTAKLSIVECIELIRNSKLVIGNDTCYAHMAAMTNTDSICVVGGWHWQRFLPYDERIILEGCRRPLIAYHWMDCYGCSFKDDVCGKKQIGLSKGTFPCIEKVSVESVINLVDEVLGKK